MKATDIFRSGGLWLSWVSQHASVMAGRQRRAAHRVVAVTEVEV